MGVVGISPGRRSHRGRGRAEVTGLRGWELEFVVGAVVVQDGWLDFGVYLGS